MSQKPQLIYVGDPMCSWCYGYAPEITTLKDMFKDSLDFKLILGGLRPHGTETMEDLGNFLHHHWEDVHKRSGQPFTYDILKDSSFVYDTEPACRAVVVARNLNPDIELDFFKDVQTVFYVDNKNTGIIDTYIPIAKKYGLDTEQFKTLFESDSIKQETIADFQLAAKLGANGFPTTLIVHEGKTYVIARGYATAKDIELQIRKILK